MFGSLYYMHAMHTVSMTNALLLKII